MHRLDRRIRILRGKRSGAFDTNQYYLERAFRARVARKLRVFLRRMEPVVLVTPRWSEAHAFLDDLAVDLAVGKPAIEARTLSMGPMLGRSVHESRAWVIRALTEFLGERSDGPIAQAVDRNGFRHVVQAQLRRVRTGPRRLLMIHQLEHLHFEALHDFLIVFKGYVDESGPDRRLNVLLAGTVDVPTLELEDAAHVVLADYSDVEAIEHLAEFTGPCDPALLRRAVDVVGGVPAMLDRLGASAEGRGGRIASNREELLRDLGALTDEVRAAVSMVSGDERLSSRLEEIAQAGQVPYDPQRDLSLVRAGLVQPLYSGLSARASIRSPMFTELALS